MSDARGFPAVGLAQAHALLTMPGSPFEMEECDVLGRRMRVWKNAPPTLREAFEAGRAHGEKTFLVHGDERATYEGFARAALAIAEELEKIGVRKGDRVAIAMRNLPEWPAAFFGTLLIGAIVTPLNAWWTGPELEFGLTDSGAKAAFVDRERLERLFEHLPNCPALERVYVSRESEEVAHPIVAKLEDVIGEVGALGQSARRGRCPPSISRPMTMRRSSTRPAPRANPKARSAPIAILAPRSWRTRFRSRAPSFDAGSRRRNRTRPRRKSASLVSIPFFHTTGCQAVMIPAFALGVKLVLMRKWDRGARAGAHRARARHLGRRRSHRRLATRRASGFERIRSQLFGGNFLWRGAGGFRTGAPDQTGLPEIGAGHRLGHDRDLGHVHAPSGRGL